MALKKEAIMKQPVLPWLLGAALAAVMVVVPQWAEAQTIKLAVISESASNWPLYVAEAKKLFEKEGLTVQMTVTRSSSKQLAAMDKSEYDIGHQAADHIIRAVEKGSELFIVMALNRPAYSIVIQPTITSFQDLKGKALAVDGAGTGYALLFKKILAQKGLKEGDYTLKEVGGTNERYEAIKTGTTAAGLINQPFDLKLFAEGFKSLGSTSDYFPHYQGSVTATKRSWAAKNQDTLVRYIRAYVAASDWLFDPKNREEAIEILLNRVKIDRAQANGTYEGSLKQALIPKAAVNLDGLRQVIEVLGEIGQVKPPLPSPEKYVDLSYYNKARGQK
jgi:ABC-type nitrate/sulfonate/bicarbonate transport system substrate-binding protein